MRTREPSTSFDYDTVDRDAFEVTNDNIRAEMIGEVLRYLASMWMEDANAPLVVLARIAGPTWSIRQIASHIGVSHGEVQRTMSAIKHGYPELSAMLDMRPRYSIAQTARRKQEADELMVNAETNKLADGTEVRLTTWQKTLKRLKR